MKILACLLTALLSTFSMHAGEQDIPKLSLSATATISKPANELQMKLGVITLALTAEEALAENSGKMRTILTNLEKAGLNQDDYETSQFSINPTFSPCPKDPPLHWRPSINGYEVTNSILVHTGKLGLAGEVIDLANRAGANSITDIRFGLRDTREYWTEALEAAGTNAVTDAHAIARATGVQLVRILSISLNHTQIRSPHLNLAAFAKAAGPSAPPIEPGDVQIEASVSIVYEIH